MQYRPKPARAPLSSVDVNPRALRHDVADALQRIRAERVRDTCAEHLRGSRVARIAHEAMLRLAQDFDARVAGIPGRVANMGQVFVAAVADERAGVAQAVDSVTAWACDPERFDAAWVSAVNATLAAARSGA